MDDQVRDVMLDGIARGVQRLDRERVVGSPRPQHKLWQIDVAFLDDEGNTVRVGCLPDALGWVVQRLHTTEDNLSLADAAECHVFVHEDRCKEPGCDGSHIDPAEASVEPVYCAKCDAPVYAGADAGDGTDENGLCEGCAAESPCTHDGAAEVNPGEWYCAGCEQKIDAPKVKP